MSPSIKIEGMIARMVADVSSAIMPRRLRAAQLVNSRESFTELRRIWDSMDLETSDWLEQAMSVSAVAEMLFLVRSAIVHDKTTTTGELEQAKVILQGCIHRYVVLENYADYCPLKNAEHTRRFMLQWKQDRGLFGGDFRDGSVPRPFAALVSLACMVSESPALHSQFVQCAQLIVRLVLSCDGHADDQGFLAALNDSMNKQRAEIDSVIGPTHREPQEFNQSPATAGSGPACHKSIIAFCLHRQSRDWQNHRGQDRR